MNNLKISGFSSVRIENAVSQLKADHRHIELCFSRYHTEKDESRWSGLMRTALVFLKVHLRLEEDIFFPALVAAKKTAALTHAPMAEHAAEERLIVELENYDPGDWHYEAKVYGLWKVVQAHMASEEGRGGMLDVALLTGIDLLSLGQQITLRREELLERLSAY